MTNLKAALLAIGFITAVSFKPLPKQQEPPQQQPTIFIIRFTPEELNIAYTALTKLPYEQSAALISSIQRQASEQAAAMQQQPKKDSTTKQNKKQ